VDLSLPSLSIVTFHLCPFGEYKINPVLPSFSFVTANKFLGASLEPPPTMKYAFSLFSLYSPTTV
jgi:hypothetical protein